MWLFIYYYFHRNLKTELLSAHKSLYLRIYPDDKRTYNNKGNALKELERYEEAIAAYDKALEIDPNYKKACENKETAKY